MTPEEIRDLLFKPIDQARIEKAKGLAQRSKMDWQRVLEVMTPEQRQQVEHAS